MDPLYYHFVVLANVVARERRVAFVLARALRLTVSIEYYEVLCYNYLPDDNTVIWCC